MWREMDGCIGRERPTEREKWTAIKWAWVNCFGDGERERVVMKENEGLCHLLCAEREAERTSLAKNSRGDPR